MVPLNKENIEIANVSINSFSQLLGHMNSRAVLRLFYFITKVMFKILFCLFFFDGPFEQGKY